jgi:uncharacterized protein YjfI (DUF2170 family)
VTPTALLMTRLQHEGCKPDAKALFAVTLETTLRETIVLHWPEALKLPPFLISSTNLQWVVVAEICVESALDPERLHALHRLLLEMNLTLPLSSFARMGDSYVLFGALALDASIEEMITEICTLKANIGIAQALLQPFMLRP